MVKKTNVILTATGHNYASPSASHNRSPAGGSNRGGFLGDEDDFIQGPRVHHVQNLQGNASASQHNFYPDAYGRGGSQSLGIAGVKIDNQRQYRPTSASLELSGRRNQH